uniref:Interleukin-1 receptor-associated kinase-like 2 n=1 Tax=Taeniopygia guttata TaxID=59729 RepID=H0ZUM6_TAEGU
MALQQPPLALRAGSAPALYIHSMPAWVLEDFCQKMDCLSDYDWMRFASYVITDQTELRKIKCMEKTGISITRELMWWWGVRLATVQQLLDLLQGLQLYRAAQVILDCGGIKKIRCVFNAVISVSGAVSAGALYSLPAPPPPPRDLLNSLQSNPPVLSSVKPCSSSTPQQETMADLLSGSLLWTQREIANATNSFSDKNRICEGTFADIYKGQRNNMVFVIKRLKELECTSPDSTQRFFHTEVQICFRCCHINILQLLGFSVETGSHCLIYPYLPNGSLQNKLQCHDDSAPLTWEMRISISLGVVRAVEYLHNFGILHGNIKSSNVLLDENFTPKLGHSGLRLHSSDKKSEYAMMKTKVLQASLTYLPEDFVRHGQLTEKVDIFSCGVVLAEILTGIKALDEDRHPIYLKDMIADEIQSAKEGSNSKVKNLEKLAAKEICCKYLDRKAGHLLEEVAVDFASAICLCLRKKNLNIAEVREIMEMAENKLKEHYICGSSTSGFSMNTPEETDDETASVSVDVPSAVGSKEESSQAAILTSGSPCAPSTGAVAPDTETSWKIQINDQKKKLMENILLYEEDKLNSSELFES